MFLLDLFVIEIRPICRDLEILYDDVYWSHGMYTLEMYDLYPLRLLRIYLYMLYDICWRRSVYFLNKCFIRVFYRFSRNRVLQLTKLKFQTLDAPILEKLKDDPILEKEIKELKKALFEHKVMVAELQRKMLDQ